MPSAWRLASTRRDLLNVSYGLAGGHKVSIELYDASGRQVRALQEFTGGSGIQRTVLDVRSGIYLLHHRRLRPARNAQGGDRVSIGSAPAATGRSALGYLCTCGLTVARPRGNAGIRFENTCRWDLSYALREAAADLSGDPYPHQWRCGGALIDAGGGQGTRALHCGIHFRGFQGGPLQAGYPWRSHEREAMSLTGKAERPIRERALSRSSAS